MKYIVILLSVFLFACSSTPKKLTPEEKAEKLAKVEQIRDQLVKPVYWLVRESCVYHVKNGNWPQTTGNKVEGELIEYLTESGVSDISFNMNLKLKTLSSEINIEVMKKPSVESVYFVRILNPKSGFNFVHHIKCVGPSLDERGLLLLSIMYGLALDISAHNTIKEKPSFIANVGEIALKTSLCILLKLDPYQCK